MNHTLYQLAFRHIKKYKQHYLFVSILIFFISLFFLSFSTVWDNYQEVVKKYNQDQYGEWYMMGKLNGKKEDLENYLQLYQPFQQYGYYEKQGDYDGYQIGHVTQNVYDLCHITLQAGRFPQNDQEIMISTQLKGQLAIGDMLTLTINQEENHYQIVGIVENSQNLFPDIYTHVIGGNTYIIGDNEIGLESLHYDYDGNGISFYLTDVTINEYGYSQKGNTQIIITYQELFFFCEMIILVAFALMTLTSTSLKRRTKELALLRSIGMTTRQLFLMVLYEVLFVSLLSIILGLIVSLIVSYGVMLYFEKQMGYLICHFHLIKLVGYAFVIMICVLVSCMQPIFSSSQQALSGNFEGRTFQYIQVRYKELKKQTKLALAIRELKVYKKLTICLFLIFGVLSTYYICMTFDAQSNIALYAMPKEFKTFHYLEVEESSQIKQIQSLIKHCPTESLTLRYISNDFIDVQYLQQSSRFSDNIYAIDDYKALQNCQVSGKLPENDHEVLIGQYCGIYSIEDTTDYHDLSIGDTFQIQNETYTVCGQLVPNETIKVFNGDYDIEAELYYMPNSAIYFYPETFDILQQQNESLITYQVRLYYQTNQEKAELTQLIQEHLSNSVLMIGSDDVFQNFEISSFIDIDPQVLVIPAFICLIFCYFINKNKMYNNSQDYALYQLIGMTKRDLKRKQLCKALCMTWLIVILEIFISIMLNLTYRSTVIPIQAMAMITITVFICSFIIYYMPIYDILKKDIFLLLNHYE